MDCNETRRILEIDTDGELDLVRHLAIETHLQTCPRCRQIADGLLARRLALRTALPRFAAPPELADKIRRALPAAPLVPTQAPARGAARFPWPFWTYAGLAASLAVAVLAGYGWGQRQGQAGRLADEAVSNHIRSLMVNHLTDVPSTDQHTVKPWFAGKLDFSPPVVDLAEAGFPLIGGRVDRLGDEDVAALVYRRRQHSINLFVWPTDRGPSVRGHDERRGYRSIGWTEQGLSLLAVSEIPASDLQEFVAAFRSKLPDSDRE